MDDTLYKISEVARYMKLQPKRIRSWVDQGILPHIKIGQTVRIRGSDLARFIEANTITIKTPDGYTGRFHLFGD